MKVSELDRDEMTRLKQLYMIAAWQDEPPTYGELCEADDMVADELMERVYAFVDIPEKFYIPEYDARFKHHIKANLPPTADAYPINGAGEGVFVIVDDETKAAYDRGESGGGYDCVLDNASTYWHGLFPGEIMPLELRGEFRPVVPYPWLVEHFTLERGFLKGLYGIE